MMASWVAQATAVSDAADPSTQTNIPYFVVVETISYSSLWKIVGGRRVCGTVGKLDLHVTN
jgi:hypothetical protein